MTPYYETDNGKLYNEEMVLSTIELKSEYKGGEDELIHS